MKKTKIVIAGGGFGGIYTFIHLHKKFHKHKNAPEIILINKHNYFLFTPLLHEVATGSVNQSNIVQPIRQIFDACCEPLITEITRIDASSNTVYTKAGEVPYDYLVLALGARTNMYHFSDDNVFPLKNLNDAQRLKNHIIDTFDRAARTKDAQERKRLLTYVVIGGGATGVEVAAEINEFAKETLALLYPTIENTDITIHLIHASSELLEQFDHASRQKAHELLEKKHHIIVKLKQRVEKISKSEIILDNGTILPTATPVLTGGVRAEAIDMNVEYIKDKYGRIEVTETLQLPSDSRIFTIGDMACVQNLQLPQTAQVAVQQGKMVAKNIIAMMERKPLNKFRYQEKGKLASLGRWMAVAEISGFKFFGHLAWWAWRTIYAGKIIGKANRIRTIVDWTINIFYPRDISKL